MELRIESEVAPLQAIVVHSPGREIDVMVPSMMEELLFDDILHLDVARGEHASFRDVLSACADEVLDVQDLLSEALATESHRVGFVKELLSLTRIDPTLSDRLLELDGPGLAGRVIEGWVKEPDPAGDHYHINPIPNLLFMRDPAFVIGGGVIISSMARATRMREALVMRQIFRNSPRFEETAVLMDAVAEHPSLDSPTLEGGDVLVPAADTVMVGFSERTNLAGIDHLARHLAAEGRVRNLIRVHLPHDRYTMHLDTVFTMIDRHEALIFPPFFAPGSGSIQVDHIELTRKVAKSGTPEPSPSGELLGVMKRCGLEIEPVPIGGDRRTNQEREQWTDGCNAFCVAPGRLLLYRRNFHTLETLAQRGYRILTAEQFVARADYYRKSDDRMVITIDASELSRARGGPRCMSMPLRRAAEE